jgi:hypothetical protein
MLWDGTVGFMLRGAISFVLRHMYTFIRRKLISIWVFGHAVPKEPSMWKKHPQLFLENSGTASVRSFLASRPLGVTLFWAIEGAGKTFILSRVSSEFQGPAHRFIYIDCAGVHTNIKHVLYRKLGMDPDEDLGRFSAYLPSDVFTTIVIDHLASNTVAAPFVASLARDSVRSSAFNVLVLLSNSVHAVALLMEGGFQYVRLLGPAFCGRWSAGDLAKQPLDSDDALSLPLVDQCGTLLPFLGPSDAHMQLKIAQSRLAWEDGERVLAGFREEFLV